jgi:hypothetical protein
VLLDDDRLYRGVRPSSVHLVIVEEVSGCLLEPQTSDLRRDACALGDVAFATLQQLNRGSLFLATGTLLVTTAVAVVANPPDGPGADLEGMPGYATRLD